MTTVRTQSWLQTKKKNSISECPSSNLICKWVFKKGNILLKNLDVVYLNVNYTGTQQNILSGMLLWAIYHNTLQLTLDFAVSNLHFSFIILYVVYMLLGFRCVTICRFSGEPFMCNTVKLGHWVYTLSLSFYIQLHYIYEFYV